MINWFRKHKFEVHLTSFTLMILASIGMYNTINISQTGLTWFLLGVFVLANGLAMLVK